MQDHICRSFGAVFVSVLVLSATPLAAQNLVENGDFASGLAGWTAEPYVTATWKAIDASGSASSGSAQVMSLGTTPFSYSGISQCLPVTGSTAYALVFRYRAPTAQPIGTEVVGSLTYHAGTSCAGEPIGGANSTRALEIKEAWTTFVLSDAANLVTPSGAGSARVSLEVSKSPTGLSAYFDDVAVVASRPTTLTIPASASIRGQNNTFFHTDLWLFNGSPVATAFVTARHRCVVGQTCVASAITFSIPPRASILKPDVLAESFGDSSTSGAIELSFNAALTKVSAVSRTYSPSLPAPTNGTSIPALASSEARTRSVLVGLASNAGDLSSGFRSNVGFYNPNATSADVTVALHGADGAPLGSPLTRTLAPFEPFQLNDVFTALGASTNVTLNAFAVVTSTVPVFSYATVIDNQSSDSVYLGSTDDAP